MGMYPIRKLTVKQFRGLRDEEFDFEGRAINAIIGQNGSMKTTVLGIIASSFSLKSSLMKDETLIDGNGFGMVLSEKFKFSPENDQAGTHEWSIFLNKRIREKEFVMKSFLRPNKTIIINDINIFT